MSDEGRCGPGSTSAAPRSRSWCSTRWGARGGARRLGCEATLRRYEERLARALAGVINLLAPEVIVLGGGLSRMERLYGAVPGLWRRHVFSDVVATRLVPCRHGDASGVRGAALLWPPAG